MTGSPDDPTPGQSAAGDAMAAASGVLAAGLLAAVLPFALGAVEGPDPAAAVRWYGALADDAGWRLAVRNSLLVGAGAALLATAAGTVAALAVRIGLRGRSLLAGAALAPAALPGAAAGFLLVVVLASLDVAGRFRGVMLAHAALGAPFAFAAVLLALRPLRPAALRTAASMGLSPGMLLGQVILPVAWPGILAGALLAFAASLAEVVAAELLAPVGQPLASRLVLAALREAPGPRASAAAVLLVLCCLLLAGIAALLLRVRLRQVLRGRQVGY